MSNIVKRDESYLLNNNDIDDLFEQTLRPLQSANARLIFKILHDSEESYLTTLDMQNYLKTYRNNLSKKELNNWLSSLQEVDLVEKKNERGKPTTIPYKRRYTFDLWRLTEKGEQTAQSLKYFNEKYPRPDEEKTSGKFSLSLLKDLEEEDFIRIENLFVNTKLFAALRNNTEISLVDLSKTIGLTPEYLENFLDSTPSRSFFKVTENEPGLLNRIKGVLGFRYLRKVKVGLSEEGKNKVVEIGLSQNFFPS